MKKKPKERYKTQSGEIVRGVTTIIGENLGWNKNALIGWARKQALSGIDPTKIKEEAGGKTPALNIKLKDEDSS